MEKEIITKDNFASSAKNQIRTYWAKTLLSFLHKHLGYKLLYLGLPGAEAKDIEEWLEYLDVIFAFQNNDDRYPDSFEKMISKLDEWERKEQISSYSSFKGYIEEVVLSGYDDNDNLFNLNEFVTVYNLDFCNQIDFPIDILTEEGKIQEVYKFDAIEKLLEIQQNIENASNKFIVFLTIHCSYKDRKTKSVLERTPHRKYIVDVNTKLKGKGHLKNARSLRLYVIEHIKDYFLKNNFIPEFLPVLHYQGDKNADMLCFTIIGTKIENTQIAFPQKTETLIKYKFIKPDQNKFINVSIEELEETDNIKTNPIETLIETHSYINYWKN